MLVAASYQSSFPFDLALEFGVNDFAGRSGMTRFSCATIGSARVAVKGSPAWSRGTQRLSQLNVEYCACGDHNRLGLRLFRGRRKRSRRRCSSDRSSSGASAADGAAAC